MKTIAKSLFLFFVLITALACEDLNSTYQKPVKITFEGVEENNNVIQIAKGVLSYTVKVDISSTKNISSVGIYQINPKTGVRGAQISKDTLFVPSVESYSFEYTVDGLTDNKGIQVVVADGELSTYVANLIIKISPEVIVSNSVIIETAEVYKGPYYASWLGGRAYLRSNGAAYSNEIDFTLTNIAITGTDTVPAFISGDLRQEKGLLFLPNLRRCTFDVTTMSKTDFDAIPNTDASVINNYLTPMFLAVKAVAGKVYAYENDTEKGLIYVESLSAKTATLEQPNGTWIKRSNNYHELKIITKTAPKQ